MAAKFPGINLHLNRRSTLHTARGSPNEVAQALSKKATDMETKAANAAAEGNLTAAGDYLMRSLEYIQRMIKDEAFESQKEALFNRLAEGMKRLGSIYLRQSRHQEAVLVLDKALKLRERDFDRYKEIEAAAKAAQSALPEAGNWEETHVQRQRKRAQAENLIDYSFTMTLLARAKLQHLQAIKRKYKHENASEEEKALFLQTAEEAAQNLETANFLLTTSIVADALRSYDTFLPDAKASQQQQQDYLAQAVEKERPNAQARELNSLGFWKGNLLEQKLLQAQIENAIQRAQLQNAAGEPDKALKILVASLRDSSSVFENYLEGLSSMSSPVVARLICHIVETRRDLLKERVKPREIRDDEGEEEVGWVITNSKVDDFLNKGDILLGQAMQALRHRHDSFEGASPELKQFESLALWEGEEALARCLYNQGILALMRDRYYHNLVDFFNITLPEPEAEADEHIDDLVNAMVRDDGLLGEEAMWEAYQLRKKFYDNSATHVEVLKCLLPLVRAYNRQGEKHEQVINLLEPVVAELQSQSTDADADADADARRTAEDKSEWLAKCLNLLAEAREQAAQSEQAEKHRLKALQILKRTRGPHDYETVQALRGLAAGFVQRELYPEAEKLLKAVLKSWNQSAAQGADMTYELIDVLHDLATIQSELKRPAEAEESFKLAVQLAQSGLGESKKGRERTKLPEANLPTLINTMGWFFYTERKPKEARPWLEKGYEALERKERIIKRMEPKIAQLFAEMQQLEQEDAEALQAAAAAQQSAGLQADVGSTQLQEQQKTILESLDSDREMNARQLINNLEALVELYTMENSPDKAATFAQRQVEVLEELIARNQAEEAELAEPLDDLAHALHAVGGKGEEASKALERSIAIQQKHKL